MARDATEAVSDYALLHPALPCLEPHEAQRDEQHGRGLGDHAEVGHGHCATPRVSQTQKNAARQIAGTTRNRICSRERLGFVISGPRSRGCVGGGLNRHQFPVRGQCVFRNLLIGFRWNPEAGGGNHLRTPSSVLDELRTWLMTQRALFGETMRRRAQGLPQGSHAASRPEPGHGHPRSRSQVVEILSEMRRLTLKPQNPENGRGLTKLRSFLRRRRCDWRARRHRCALLRRRRVSRARRARWT